MYAILRTGYVPFLVVSTSIHIPLLAPRKNVHLFFLLQDAAKYAKGRGIFASGSPFEDAAFDGKVTNTLQYAQL